MSFLQNEHFSNTKHDRCHAQTRLQIMLVGFVRNEKLQKYPNVYDQTFLLKTKSQKVPKT